MNLEDLSQSVFSRFPTFYKICGFLIIIILILNLKVSININYRDKFMDNRLCHRFQKIIGSLLDTMKLQIEFLYDIGIIYKYQTLKIIIFL